MVVSLSIGMVMILVILLGFNGTVKSVLDVVGNYISYFTGPAAGAFILAMFTSKANDKGVACGFLAGLAGGWLIAIRFRINWLWNPFVGAIITLVLGYVCSFLFKDENSEARTEYTAWAIRKKLMMEEQDKDKKFNMSNLPFSFGKHEWIVLLFFVAQYVFLALIQY